MEAARRYSEANGGQAMMVMLEGKIIFEGYGNVGGAERRQTLASGTKSFTGVVAVAAVEDGFIKLDDAVCESVAEWKNDGLKSRVTYRRLLTLTSGLTPGAMADVIREQREARGLSKCALAKRAGISREMVRRVES
jgi:CubicO group peptidase (beta-lactamase class C family)